MYAQDFERIFQQSYGCRTGMDEDSCNMLKRDLFVLKWQEKVLPSAETYVDALHQARANEEQSRQLANLHGAGGTHSQRKETGKETEKEPDGNATKALPKEKETSQGRLRCYKCCGTHHLLRDCPMRRPPEEAPGRTTPKINGASSNVVIN